MEFLGVDIKIIILAIVTVSNGILAMLVYLRSKEKSSMYFVLTIVLAAIWTFGISVYTQPGISMFTRLASNVNYTTTAVIAVSFFFFAFYFGTENKKVSTLLKIGTTLFLFTVFFFIQIPNSNIAVIGDIHLIDGAKKEIYGSGYNVYLLLLIGYFVSGLLILTKKYFKSTGKFKKQLIFMIFGTGIAIITGIITNIVLPNYGLLGYEWIGPIGTLIMIFFIFYAVTRHNLWDFKILTIQLFVTLMVVAMFLQVFIAQNFNERIIRVIIFIIMFSFSFFLIKSLLQEVEDREKMESLAGKLYKANSRLQVIDIEKSDFVSITSHQFRTPLTIIKGYTSMLLEGSFGLIENKKQIVALGKIYQASQRLVLTIEEFLNISRIDQNQMTYTLKKIDLRKLVAQSINNIKQTLKDVGLRLTFNIQIKDDYFTMIDQSKIKLVITNILDNSIKYTHNNGSIEVSLIKQRSSKTILLKVKDNGIGIKNEMLNRLFEKFSRGTSVSKLHTEGRGLGLYISRQIINAQGGRIWAESAGENKGSTFFIEFPDWEYERQRKEIKEFVEEL